MNHDPETALYCLDYISPQRKTRPQCLSLLLPSLVPTRTGINNSPFNRVPKRIILVPQRTLQRPVMLRRRVHIIHQQLTLEPHHRIRHTIWGHLTPLAALHRPAIHRQDIHTITMSRKTRRDITQAGTIGVRGRGGVKRLGRGDGCVEERRKGGVQGLGCRGGGVQRGGHVSDDGSVPDPGGGGVGCVDPGLVRGRGSRDGWRGDGGGLGDGHGGSGPADDAVAGGGDGGVGYTGEPGCFLAFLGGLTFGEGTLGKETVDIRGGDREGGGHMDGKDGRGGTVDGEVAGAGGDNCGGRGEGGGAVLGVSFGRPGRRGKLTGWRERWSGRGGRSWLWWC